MNAKEMYNAYDGNDVVLHITDGELTERQLMSIRISKATDRLKYVDVYEFRFEDGHLVMYAQVNTILFNIFMNREFMEEDGI